MLISENYRSLNQQLHEQMEHYGVTSRKWVSAIKQLSDIVKSNDILDYGCGKGLLKQGLGNEFKVKEYDPCIPGKEADPEPADVVVCTDVLEHIEPECVENVLEDLARLTKKIGFLTIHIGASLKTLPDGRNTHLIQEKWPWWKERLLQRFDIERIETRRVKGPDKLEGEHEGNEVIAIVKPKTWPNKNTFITPLRVFIGFDPRQVLSYTVLQSSILQHAKSPIAITPLVLETLPMRRVGLTPFTYSRFLVPYLCGYNGWALFLDSDIIVKRDISELFALADKSKAVMVSKNEKKFEWASVILFNNAACRILTPEYIETSHDLHGIGWCDASKIGDLPREWNVLVGYDQPNPDAKLLHYTQGVPAWQETRDCDHSSDWFKAFNYSTQIFPWAVVMGQSVHTAQTKDGKLVPRYVADRAKKSPRTSQIIQPGGDLARRIGLGGLR